MTLPPSMVMKTLTHAPQRPRIRGIPISTYPVSPTSTSGPIAIEHDFCALQECLIRTWIRYRPSSRCRRDYRRRDGHEDNDKDDNDNDNSGGGEGNALMRGPGNVKEEGEMKVGMPMAHDDDDGHALLGIEEGVEGATIAHRIMALRHFARPPLPAHPNTNLGLLCIIQPPQPPQIHVSPILRVGEHESAMHQDPRPPVRRASAPRSYPQSPSPILSPMAQLP
ncbi:uncharacterized protein ARMOST_12430 [Armillaria ostoyae]|uniref:Uncharacterized protein n=1 Tax=Armillaria ostoyae TaxID=47428 RepID=A0A284RJY6_ARMOS|nr:uncharacterized protein ARMOST_12430 [Armillaria ostoyae]